MTITDVEAAFGDKEVATLDELIAALKITDAHPEDQEEGQTIQDWLRERLKLGFGITEQEVYNNGKRCQAYVKSDFELDERGHPRGTAAFLNQRMRMVEAARERLTTRHVLDRLKQVAQGLKEDEPKVAERLRRLEAAIEVEYRCTYNMGDR
jgi:hypothetical protein